jgi:hypothetical protein
MVTMCRMLQEEAAVLAEEDAKKAKKKEEEEDEEEEEEDDEDKEGKISNKKKKVRAVASPFWIFMYTPPFWQTLDCFHALSAGRGLVIRACASSFRQRFDRGLQRFDRGLQISRLHVPVLAKIWLFLLALPCYEELIATSGRFCLQESLDHDACQSQCSTDA